MDIVAGSSHCDLCGEPSRRAVMARPCRSRRGRRTGHRCIRVAQEPGRPCGLHLDKMGRGAASPNAPGPPTGVGREGRDEDRRTGWYCQSKDNEGRRDGSRGVGASHSTAEPGELASRGSWGGKGALGRGTVEGPHGGNSAFRTVSTKRRRLAELTQPASRSNCGGCLAATSASLSCSEPMTQRAVCLNWARTDLWEGRGAIPAPTRPVTWSR